MAKDNVLVKTLQGVETLVSVILSPPPADFRLTLFFRAR